MALTKMLIFYAGFHVLEWLILSRIIILLNRWGLWYETEMGTPKPTHFYLWIDPPFILLIISSTYSHFQGENDTNVPKWSSDMFVKNLNPK
jgi:hypothetical protein